MPRKKDSNEEPGPMQFKRDEYGLLINTQYTFNEDGSVDWRSMIKNEHLFPNKSWFQLRKKDVPRSIDNLADHQLLIKLSGIKELARMRGFSSVSYEVVKCELDHVAVICKMTFLPNFETCGESVTFQDIANATTENTNSFAKKFLETIACNRAFVRCVRNFLNVHIVGDDEIDKSDPKENSQPNDISPSGFLKKELKDSHGISTYEKFLPMLREMHKQNKISISTDIIKNWHDFTDISAKDCRILLGVIKNL
jgi:hypothetical protein